MRVAKEFYPRLFFVFALFVFTNINTNVVSQTPEVFDEGTLREQFDFLHERTNIYNNFRAIREDMFQKIKNNSTDSLARVNVQLVTLTQQVSDAKAKIDSLNLVVSEISDDRDKAIRERESMFFFGIRMHKTLYNLILWSIIAALVVMLVIGFLVFKKNSTISLQTTNDLKALGEEFETYRKTSRERFEQQSIDHFNEIKRLKGRI